MAKCRVYLFTYKRNNLLPRAVQSLLDQTFKDWVCEVHNDCPEDRFPSDYIESLNDPRFTIVNHSINSGATASFNMAFRQIDETYASILEDDNWWQPDFLQKMIPVMDLNPHVEMAWSNMRIWKENDNKQWENTGNTVWPVENNDKLFYWPDYRQAMGALHSNGAMLFRGKYADKYLVPTSADFDVMEAARERTYKSPLYLVSEPLANFAVTLQTTRTADPLLWNCNQILLLSTWLQGSNYNAADFKELLKIYRAQKPSPVAVFFLTVICVLKDYQLLRLFNAKDWYYFLRWTAKNKFNLKRLKSRLKAQQEVYDFLLDNTIKRTQENIYPQQETAVQL